MMKDVEYHQQQQQQQHPGYPSQIPSAPPSYAEAVFNTTPHAFYPQPELVFPPGPATGTQFVHESTYIQPGTAGIEVQRTIIALPLGPNPARITCPQCHADVLTAAETEPSCVAHLCCLLLLLVGCCPLSSLPYCMDSLKNVRHSCPNCKAFLGTYHP